MEIAIRPQKQSDLSYIFSSFLGFWKGIPGVRYAKNSASAPKIIAMIDSLIRSKSISVCCNGEDEEHIFGYLIYDRDTIYMVMVKETFRELGIATALIDHSFKEPPRIACFQPACFNKLRKRLSLEVHPFKIIEEHYGENIESLRVEDSSSNPDSRLKKTERSENVG